MWKKLLAKSQTHTLFYEDHPILPISLFKILSTPPSPSPLTSTPSALFVLLLWLNSDCTTFDVLLNYVMDVHMSYLGTLIPEEPCCVFYPTR